MIIHGKNEGDLAPVSPGLHRAVCSHFEDLGERFDAVYDKKRHTCLIIWELDENIPDTDKPYVLSKTYTASLHRQASLRKDLESWRGRSFTKDELDAFDTDVLVGQQATLNVIHVTKDDGSIRARVDAVLPAQKGAAPLTIQNVDAPDWVEERRKENAASLRAPPPTQFGDGDEMPF